MGIANGLKNPKNRVKRSLERISDPRKKFEVMVNNGLVEEATSYLNELVGSMVAYFDWNSSDRNRGELCCIDNDPDSPIDSVKIGFHPADTDLSKNRLNIHHESVLNVDLRGVIHTFGWSDEQILQFVRRVLEKMVDYPIYPHYFVWVIEGMQRVSRHFLASDDELSLRVEKWILLYRFRDGRLFELRQRALLVPVYREDGTREITTDEIREELDPIVDRMLEIGMSKEEVREEFLNWLSERSTQGCGPQLMLAIAGAKCFEFNDKERSQLLRETFLSKMWENLVLHDDVESFVALGDVGLWKRTRKYSEEGVGDESFFCSELTKLLAKGKAGQVFQLLFLIGEGLGLCDGGYTSLGSKVRHRVPSVKQLMNKLSVDAFSIAVNDECYGIAAALTQSFDCMSEKDLVLEADQSVVEEVAEFAGDYVKEDPEELALIINEGLLVHSDPEDEDHEKHLEEFNASDAKFSEIREKRDARLNELKAERVKQFKEVTELAIDLEQPICLEWMVFIGPTEW